MHTDRAWLGFVVTWYRLTLPIFMQIILSHNCGLITEAQQAIRKILWTYYTGLSACTMYGLMNYILHRRSKLILNMEKENNIHVVCFPPARGYSVISNGVIANNLQCLSACNGKRIIYVPRCRPQWPSPPALAATAVNQIQYHKAHL